MEHTVGITIPIFWGQGVITPIGFLPKRSPINTVVGAPIAVTRSDFLQLGSPLGSASESSLNRVWVPGKWFPNAHF